MLLGTGAGDGNSATVDNVAVAVGGLEPIELCHVRLVCELELDSLVVLDVCFDCWLKESLSIKSLVSSSSIRSSSSSES